MAQAETRGEAQDAELLNSWPRITTMPHKRPSKLRTFSLPSTNTIEHVDHEQYPDIGIQTVQTESPAEHGEHLPDSSASALREMLEADDYRVALVAGSRDFYRSQQDSAPFLIPTNAVLLPFSWKELVLGVRESLDGPGRVADSKIASFGDVHINFTKMEVSRSSGGLVAFTRQEFKTLACFAANPGRVLSRQELLNEAWGYTNYPTTRTVDNHVLRLRRKLELDPAHPLHFQTVHGVGYKFLP